LADCRYWENSDRALKRTGIGSIVLLRGARDKPEGLTPARIESWIRGSAKVARKDQLDYVLARWKSLESNGRVDLTEAMLEQLRNYRSTTGVSTRRLFRCMASRPEGFTPQMLENWLAGSTKTAQKDHLDAVIEGWERFPPLEKRERPVVPQISPVRPKPPAPKHEDIKPGYRLDELPNNIRKFRETKGLSAAGLAVALGVARSTISVWEMQRRRLGPDVETKIASVLGEMVETLFSAKW